MQPDIEGMVFNMYMPKQFEVTELGEVKKFVAQVRSADLITTDNSGQPLATLMPCLWLPGKTDFGQLVMHMSRGNDQWKSISDGQLGLAIVHGVQAYISPNNYASKSETGKVVPTWNYTSVHLSGTVTVTHDTQELLQIVEELTDHHEKTEVKPWQVSDAPEDYIAAQLRAIVGVRLEINKVEAKAKLNQNRSSADRAGVITALKESSNPEDLLIANLMSAENDQVNHLS
jgi:transcriptional regulator